MPNLTIVRKDVPNRIPVRPAVTEYLTATHRQRVAGSQKAAAWQLYAFADFCDSRGISLESVDASTVNAFLDHYEVTGKPHKAGATTISKVTLAGVVTSVKAFLAWCSRDRQIWGDFVETSTVATIKKPRLPVVIITVFTSQQIRQLLEACDGEENDRMRTRARTIVHVLVGTGLRASELCTLTMADTHIQDEHPYILVVAGKGDKSRRVPLGPITLRKLSHWIALYRTNAPPKAPLPPCAPLFTTRAGEEAMGRGTLTQLFERLGERAQITSVRVSPHTCRHFFACECIKRKMSIYALSKLLGHSSVVMTERYCRALGADFDELAEMVQGQLR